MSENLNLPWTCEEIGTSGVHNEFTVCDLYDSTGRNFAMLSNPNAAFIVRACNNHEALVDACRSALIRIEELAGEKLHDYCGCTCCELKQAIEKATT